MVVFIGGIEASPPPTTRGPVVVGVVSVLTPAPFLEELVEVDVAATAPARPIVDLLMSINQGRHPEGLVRGAYPTPDLFLNGGLGEELLTGWK